MRQTLRRSCSACAKSKHSCDLRTPRCSRCVKRQVQCLYANEPLSAPDPPGAPGYDEASAKTPTEGSSALTGYRFAALDPFESYPQTRLPREHVQRLIHSFLHKIAFQYYPLDLNAATNPFLVSWWPLALGDPALFHVSLQTACLDEELLARRGFRTSELLMADSVSLLRRKVGDSALAVHDGTMNSVITLAAIEFGKGNTKVSEMHVDGARRLVNMRGGINAVRQTSPLTARMVSWVSMIVSGRPQFDTQDDDGIGDGIPPIPEWQLDPPAFDDKIIGLDDFEVHLPVRNVFFRLRHVFRRAQRIPLSTTRLHDLACFVIHRLLLSAPDTMDSQHPPMTECARYGIILYMFLIQGTTYFSHAVMLNALVERFMEHVRLLESTGRLPGSFDIWYLTVGMAASTRTEHYAFFLEKSQALATSWGLANWDDVLSHIRGVLWLEAPQSEHLFRTPWEALLGITNASKTTDLALRPSPSAIEALLLSNPYSSPNSWSTGEEIS